MISSINKEVNDLLRGSSTTRPQNNDFFTEEKNYE